MNTTTSAHKTFREVADAHSLRMFHMTQGLKMMAAHMEMKRTLEEIGDVLTYRPEMEKVLSACVKHHDNWREFEDVSGEVLRHMAQQLDELNTAVVEHAYSRELPELV
jgi:hypothetical protein